MNLLPCGHLLERHTNKEMNVMNLEKSANCSCGCAPGKPADKAPKSEDTSAECSCGCDSSKSKTTSPKGENRPADCSCGCDPNKPAKS